MAAGDIDATVAQARRLASSIGDLKGKVQRLLGASAAEVERVRLELETLMRQYDEATLRQRKAFQRELEGVAAAATRLAAEIPPKPMKVLDTALVHARRLHFANARKTLRKLDKPLGLYRELRGTQEDYRKLHRGMQQAAKDLELEVESLRAVPKPPVAPAEVARIMGLLKEYNREASEAYRALLMSPPPEAMALLLQGASSGAPGIPQPPDSMAAPELVRYLKGGAVPRLPGSGVRGLVELAQYSDARLAHLLVDPKPLRRLLQANLTWLRGLAEAEGRALTLSWEQLNDAAGEKLAILARYLQRIPGAPAEGARARLEEIRSLVTSGALWQAQLAESLYRTHGDAARWRWEGSMEGRLEALGRRLSATQEALKGLRPPEEFSTVT